jgi:phosphoglycolate phosphatase
LLVTVTVAGLVIWDVDGTLLPADLRWLRRAIARTYGLSESAIVFPSAKVHGYTDESIVKDAAIASGLAPEQAESGILRFHQVLAQVMDEGRDELVRDQPAYPGAKEAIGALHRAGFVQTVLTGNLRTAAEAKLTAVGLDQFLDLRIGAFGSDARDRFDLPAVVEQRFRTYYGGHLQPSRVVVIGDAPNDIACARHANFHVAVVAHRVGAEELAPYQPDAILENLSPELVVATVTGLVGGTCA